MAILNVDAAKGTIGAAANRAVIIGVLIVQADAAAADHDLFNGRIFSTCADDIARQHGAVRDLQLFQRLCVSYCVHGFVHKNAVGVQIGIPNGNAPIAADANASKMRQPDLAVFNNELAVAAHADPIGENGECVRGCNAAVSDGELPTRRVCVPADQNLFGAERRKLCVRNGDASNASAGGSADAGAVLTGNGFNHIAVDGDAFAIHSLGIAVRKATDGCAAALGGNGDLTAGDANVALTADACRTAFSDRMDDAAGDGDTALACASIANGGVIAIGCGFYRSSIDGNGCCPDDFKSASADAEAISLGSCLDSTAVDGDTAVFKRPDPVSGEHPVRIFSKVVDAPTGGYIAVVDGDRAAISCGDRIVGSLGDDRASVDGNAATITVVARADAYACHSKRIAFRQGKGFGTDDAAVDGDAAALPAVVDLTAVGGAKLNFFCTCPTDGGGIILPLGADIAAVDDDRALAFADTIVACSPARTAADAGHSAIRPYRVMDHPVEVEIRREARRQPAHGALIGALSVDGEGVAHLYIDAPLRREVAAVR